jgi:hypothetical protein
MVPAGQVNGGGLIQAGQVAREEFDGNELEVRAETQAHAIAQREKAAVEARFIVAMKHPRDVDMFRDRLLRDCRRPGFAEKAEYARPVGGGTVARGPSIRFIEAALRCFGNVYPEVAVVFDSAATRICRVSVVDLESNVTYTTEVVVPKAVEKRGEGKDGAAPPKGREVLSKRINSQGYWTFLVPATDDEVLVKQNAMLSKAIRTAGQRLLPYDIVEEAIAMCRTTKQATDSKDPDAARRKIMDAFSEIGIKPADLKDYLGHSPENLTPPEMEELRGVYTAIKDGDSNWSEVMAMKDPQGSREEQKKVAEDKIAALTKKKDADAKPAEKTAAEAPSAEAIPEDPSLPKEPRHFPELRAWRETIGGVKFSEILGQHGFEELGLVTAQAWPDVEKELAQAAADAGKTKVAPVEKTGQKKLKL